MMDLKFFCTSFYPSPPPPAHATQSRYSTTEESTSHAVNADFEVLRARRTSTLYSLLSRPVYIHLSLYISLSTALSLYLYLYLYLYLC
jgi:hypothetical protein